MDDRGESRIDVDRLPSVASSSSKKNALLSQRTACLSNCVLDSPVRSRESGEGEEVWWWVDMLKIALPSQPPRQTTTSHAQPQDASPTTIADLQRFVTFLSHLAHISSFISDQPRWPCGFYPGNIGQPRSAPTRQTRLDPAIISLAGDH